MSYFYYLKSLLYLYIITLATKTVNTINLDTQNSVFAIIKLNFSSCTLNNKACQQLTSSLLFYLGVTTHVTFS